MHLLATDGDDGQWTSGLNTGLIDLINEKNSIPIECKNLRECDTLETIGWGKDLDATVEALETLYQSRTKRTCLGHNGRRGCVRMEELGLKSLELKAWLAQF